MANWPHITMGGLFSLAMPTLCFAAEDGGGHGGGGIQGDLALWSLVAFVGFVIVIRKMGWKGFVDGLADRERRINEAISEAEDKNRHAQRALIEQKGQLEAIDETTREIIDEAHRDAQRTRSDIVDSATREAESLKRRALREVERTHAQSLKGLFDAMAVRVVEQTEQRLRESLSDAEQQRLMDESLEQFAAAGRT